MSESSAIDGPNDTKLRIGIASLGRFWLLDLARELDALGHDVRFYSYVPRKRAESFGLPRRCHVGLLPVLFPFVALERLFPRPFARLAEHLMAWAVNIAVILFMRRCDIFICLSGIYLAAPRYARRRYGARIFLERGSRHILSQREILSEFPGAQQPSNFIVRRELAGYELADKIVIPSTHVLESFLDYGADQAKLFRNPYGVDLDQFPIREAASAATPTEIFVGIWSYRKGVDVLIDCLSGLDGANLLHVGPVGDMAVPDEPWFKHYDAVPQWQLSEFYRRAHVFVLASREEGLAMVQAQALASGLRLVCTDRTGGADLGHSPAMARRIQVVPANDSGALRKAIVTAFEEIVQEGKDPLIEEQDRNLLSWTAYGARYQAEILAYWREGSSERGAPSSASFKCAAPLAVMRILRSWLNGSSFISLVLRRFKWN